MVKLVYNDQQGRERAIDIGPQRNMVTIGRNPDCHVQTNNASVSRVHAMVTWQDGRVFVQDPPSGRPTNGTYVDGMRLQAGELLELCANSEFKCGNFLLRVVDDDSGGQVRPMGAQGAGQGRPIGHSSQPVSMGGAVQNMGPATGGAFGPPYVGASPQSMNTGPGAGPGPGPMGPGAQGPQQGVNYQPGSVTGQGQYGAGPAQGQYGAPKGGPNYSPQGGRVRAGGGPVPVGGAPQGGNVVPAAMMGVKPEEHNRVLEELSAVRQELEALRTAKEAAEDALKQSKDSLEERERAIADLENRTDHHDTVVDSLNDMIKHLKEQLEHQKDQLQDNKREIVTLEEQNENLEYELGALKQSLESKGMATSNAETSIANLKVQLTQKNRHLTELQRELDLTQYAVKEERENVERLQHNIEELNTNLEESERHCRDMKKVVEQHEAMFGELRSTIEDRNNEIRRFQSAVRATGGDSGALLAELAGVREELQRKQRECDSLKEQLRSAEALIASTGQNQDNDAALKQVQSQLAELEQAHGELLRERSELERALHDARSAGGSGEELESLKRELENVRSESDSGMSPDLAQQLKRVYDSTNDSVSQWRDNLLSIENHIHNLQRVFRYFMRIDLAILAPNDKIRLENTLNEFDPRIIFEEVASLLEADQSSFGDIKENLRELRSLLQ